MIQVYPLDSQLRRLAPVAWRQVEARVMFNQVGAFTVDLQATPRHRQAFVPGRAVEIVRDSATFLAGVVEDIVVERDSEVDGTGPGRLSVTGADFLKIVESELAYPDPTQPTSAQTSWFTDDRSGALETVIKAYVSANVGVGRPSWRNDTAGQWLVTVPTSLGRGPAVSYKARMDPLLELIRKLTVADTPEMGVRVTPDSGALVFDVYEPADKTGTCRFSWSRGNLRRIQWGRSAPTVTHVVVAGSGTGVARNLRERKNTASAAEWRVVTRTFVDERGTAVASELDQAADTELARGRRSAALAAEIVETGQVRYGDAFGLGDRVRVEVDDGVSYVDVVTSVALAADTDSGEEAVTITVGAETEPDDLALYQRVRDIDRRTGLLERSV